MGDAGRVRVDRNGFTYVTKFRLWESRAAVRSKPRRVLREEWHEGRLFFPPELVPVSGHPLVAMRGPRAVEQVLMQYLHVYLDFTAELEQLAVNPVAQRISRRRLGLCLPEAMIEDAHKICTDESWHAQFSDDLQRQLVDLTETPAAVPAEPQFMRRLRAAQARADPDIADLVPLLFTIVSETLISAILAGIPRDPRVLTAVRELVSDHAQDEGRHHAFFAALFARVWPALSPRRRALAAPLLAEFVVAFLEPDRAALVTVLHAAGVGRCEAQQVVSESHPPAEVAAAIRAAAASSLRLFAAHGVFEDPGAVDAFVARGLLDASGSGDVA